MVRQVRGNLVIQSSQPNRWNVNLVGRVGTKESIDEDLTGHRERSSIERFGQSADEHDFPEASNRAIRLTVLPQP